ADPTATPYYNYCGELAGPRGKGYYARTLGSWRVYFLNTEYSGTEQNAWLAQDLPLWSESYHIAAMWHIPMFASVCAHHSRAMVWPSKTGPWWDILVKHGAEFVASGHAHRWERFPRMLRNGSASSTGIRQFLTGVGGVNNMDILTVHPLSQSQVIAKGIVKFTLHSDRYEWSFKDLSGVVRDSGVQTTRKTVTSPTPPDTIPVDTIPQDTTCS
ncbi:MAG TPA: hypothetical protein VD930_00005, partial [Gemmatimonadales bacterium]|nr:hypothetical protein [Gemmatimonadales bacterium]